nr:glycosyltransferase family 1 protein [Acidipropionibacterium virtanenii]
MATALAETRYGRSHPASVDVVHFLADTGPLMTPRGPSVVTVHGVASRWTTVSRSRAADRLWRTRVARAVRLCDRIITVSHSSASDVAEVFGVPTDRITVIYHGLEANVIHPPEETPARLRGLVDEGFVLYLGNVEPRKNLVNLAGAFSTDALRSTRLVVAGRPAWDYKESLAAFEQADNVDYLGFVSDEERSWLYSHCRLFVFPSHYEGFGLPVLEALGAGVPVACSDRGSLAEVAGPAKVLPGIDVAGISEGISDALSDEGWRSRIGTLGPQWASRFTWQKSVDRHLDLYQELVG